MTLEQVYRSNMRWYPRSWRRANEDVVVGTLLDIADADGRVAPARDEIRDLRRSGLGARADSVLPAVIRDRVAAVSVGAGTALAIALLTGQAWAGWVPTGGPWPQAWLASSPELLAPDGVVWQLLIHPSLWVLGALAALARWTAISRVLLVATLPASAISLGPSDVSFLLRPSLFALVMMSVLALLACVGRPPRRWQLLATAIMGVLTASWLVFAGPLAGTYFPRGGLLDLIRSPWPLVAMLIAASVLMLRRQRAAAAGVMVASAPWLMVLIGDAVIGAGFASGLDYRLNAVVVAAVLLIIPLAILLVARRYARPPWHSPSESSDSPTSASRPSSTR